MRRIVVTGLGAVSPLAAGVEASWSRLLAVAGLSNKMAAFSNRLTPRSMQRATMRRIMGP